MVKKFIKLIINRFVKLQGWGISFFVSNNVRLLQRSYRAPSVNLPRFIGFVDCIVNVFERVGSMGVDFPNGGDMLGFIKDVFECVYRLIVKILCLVQFIELFVFPTVDRIIKFFYEVSPLLKYLLVFVLLVVYVVMVCYTLASIFLF
jgi:hypothetical protein